MTRIPGRIFAAALVTFLAVIAVEDVLRGDLSATRHWISHLSIGTWGWVNIADLAFGGVTLLLLARRVRGHASGRWSARWVGLTGLGLVVAAVFISDAPPGTRYDDAVTWTGQVHDAGGALTFIGLFASCLATRRLVSARWGIVAAVTVATGWIAASAMAAIDYADPAMQLPAGLAERVAMLAGIGWLIGLAVGIDTVQQGGTTHELRGLPQNHQG